MEKEEPLTIKEAREVIKTRIFGLEEDRDRIIETAKVNGDYASLKLRVNLREVESLITINKNFLTLF